MTDFHQFFEFVNRILLAKGISISLRGFTRTDTSCFGSGPGYPRSNRSGIRNDCGEEAISYPEW